MVRRGSCNVGLKDKTVHLTGGNPARVMKPEPFGEKDKQVYCKMSELKSPENKKFMKSPSGDKAKTNRSGGRRCVFCEQSSVDEDSYGKLLSKAGLSAHYFCMLFSSGLSQNGKSEKQGILGFLPDDIMREVKRGLRLRCSYCRKVGATIGCVVRNCKKMFHLGCGRESGTLHQFFDTFSSFCPAHRPQQDVPAVIDPSYVCSICMNTVECKPSQDTLRAPCCRNAWYHRPCVQNYAKSAGLYFFKCPLCNNKEEFQMEMLTYGIYIPDQDASWETEPHAFQELLERYQHCDAKICKCAEGRKYDKEGSKWELLICDNCGSAGGHVECHHLIKKGKDYICPECNEVDRKYFSPKMKQTQKRKSLEAHGDDLSPAEKQAREIPKPSNRMRKTGLPCVVSTSPDGRVLPASPRRRRAPRNREGYPTTSPTKRKRMSNAAEKDNLIKKQRLKSPDGKLGLSLKSPANDNDYAACKVESIELGTLKMNENKEKRLSLEDFKDGTHFRLTKDKRRTHKRHSLQPGGTQKTLEGWLKLGTFKPREKSPQNLFSDNNMGSNTFTKKTPVKRPAVIEYRGKKLQIKSPRVVLRKNIDISGNLKPRALDLNPKKGPFVPSIVVTTGKALLADLDNGFRVTRNMVSNADGVRSPSRNPMSVRCSKGIGPNIEVGKKAEKKLSDLFKDSSENLSDVELTPKSRKNLLQSAEKKKHTPSCTKPNNIVIQIDDSDLTQTPTSRELRSSGKKKGPVSNMDSRHFWSVSGETEPITPTSSDQFFPLKGLLDENCNHTPISKPKLNEELVHMAATPVSIKTLSNIDIESKGKRLLDEKPESLNIRNSPVLRSAAKVSTSLNGFSHTCTPERKSEFRETKLECKLSKATRSLSHLYASDVVDKVSKHNIDETLDDKNGEGMNDMTKGMNSPSGTIELAKTANVSVTQQLTPKRKMLCEATPPRIKRTSKSLSELKRYKRHKNTQSVNKEQVKNAEKMKRKTELFLKTKSKPENKFEQILSREPDFQPGNLQEVINLVSPPSRNGRGRSKRRVSLLNGDSLTDTKIQSSCQTQSNGLEGLSPEKQTSNKETFVEHKKIDESDSYAENKIGSDIETIVSDTTKEALMSYLSKNKRNKRSVPARSESVLQNENQVQLIMGNSEDSDFQDSLNQKILKSNTASRIDHENKRKKKRRRENKSKVKSSVMDFGMTEETENLESSQSSGCTGPVCLNSNRSAIEDGKIDGKRDENSELTAKIGSQDHDMSGKLDKLEGYDNKKITGSRLKKGRNGKDDCESEKRKPRIDQKLQIETALFKNLCNKSESETCGSSVTMTHLSDNSKSRISHRFNKETAKEILLTDIIDEALEKYIGLYGEEKTKNVNAGETGMNRTGCTDCNKIPSSEKQAFDSPVKNFPVQNQITHSEVARKGKVKPKSPEKTKCVNLNNVHQHKGSVKILREAADKLSMKFIDIKHSASSPCENTCPNPQPMLNTKGAANVDSVPLVVLASMIRNLGKDNSDADVSSGMGTSNYYSSLLSLFPNEVGKFTPDSGTDGREYSSPNSGITSQRGPLLKIKSTVDLEKCKEIKALAEQIKNSADNFHNLSRASPRSSEEYVSDCLVGLSLSPSYITRFCRSLSESLEERQGSDHKANPKINGVRKEFPLLERLEAACSDVSSDKLAMSEYYASDDNTGDIDLDLDDIRPLTDIQT